jgi:hypothetical protein
MIPAVVEIPVKRSKGKPDHFPIRHAPAGFLSLTTASERSGVIIVLPCRPTTVVGLGYVPALSLGPS